MTSKIRLISRKRLASLMLVVLFSLTSVLNAEVIRSPEEHFFDETFWDFSEELERAKEENKKAILLMFEMDECPFCHRMKRTVLNRAEVQDYFKEHFLIFPVDIEGDVSMVDFAGNEIKMKDFAFKRFRVRATPTYLFFDLEGNPIKRSRFTGAMQKKEEFLLYGQFIVDEEYEKSSFSRYKRNKKKK